MDHWFVPPWPISVSERNGLDLVVLQGCARSNAPATLNSLDVSTSSEAAKPMTRAPRSAPVVGVPPENFSTIP